MLTNLIGKIAVRTVRGKLNGYHTIIGGIGMLLYFGVIVVGKLLPEHNLPGSEVSFEDALGICVAGLTALGVIGKAYKAGVDTPVQPLEVSKATGPVIIRDPLDAERR